MHIAAALSAHTNDHAIATDIANQIRSEISSPPDLLLVFITAPLRDSFDAILRHLRLDLSPKVLLACIAESILGVDRELERQPAVSALAMSLPNVTLHTFHLADDEWQNLLGDADTLRQRLQPQPQNDADEDNETPEEPPTLRGFLMLGDPFTAPIVQLLAACTYLFPNAPIFGGMASGITQPGEVKLALNDETFSSGLIGVSFAGPIQIDCVVSQGCRPIGDTQVVTKADRNIIHELGGKTAVAAVEEMITQLGSHDRDLLQTQGLQVGMVIDAGKGHYGRGDFLVRSILDIRRDTGAIAIGDLVKPGQTIQFHVRDAASAIEDLKLLLDGELLLANAPMGIMLFTCNGRGTRMFDQPHTDITITQNAVGPVPIAGFFCAGELGPVGGRNFIHGQTASLALFRPVDGIEPGA